MNKRIIFGIGSGKCGTHSLHKLMLKQDIMRENNSFENKFLYVKHEGENINAMRTYNECSLEETVNKYIEMVNNNDENKCYYSRGQTPNNNNLHIRKNISGKSKYHINIGFTLLPYIENFIERYDNIAVIALKRDKKQTIMSIYKEILLKKQIFKNKQDRKIEEDKQLEEQRRIEEKTERREQRKLEKEKRREERKKRKKNKKSKKRKDEKSKKNEIEKLIQQRENELNKFREEGEVKAKVERKKIDLSFKLSERLGQNRNKFKEMMKKGEIIISSDSDEEQEKSIQTKDKINEKSESKTDELEVSKEPNNFDKIKLGYFYEHFVSKNPEISDLELLKNIKSYYEEYYLKIEYLVNKYPNKIRLYDMNDVLNNEKIQKEMMIFAGFKYPIIETNIGKPKKHSSKLV